MKNLTSLFCGAFIITTVGCARCGNVTQGNLPDALAAYCKERLAAYKYPRHVEILPELPKTASGKILRRELRSRPQDSQ